MYCHRPSATLPDVDRERKTRLLANSYTCDLGVEANHENARDLNGQRSRSHIEGQVIRLGNRWFLAFSVAASTRTQRNLAGRLANAYSNLKSVGRATIVYVSWYAVRLT